MLCVLAGVGVAAADSTVTYPNAPAAPNNSLSLTISLGGGVIAFVFIDSAGTHDIFIQIVNSAGNLAQASLNQFTGSAIWLHFEGFNQNFMQYGVYVCSSPQGQTCNVGSVKRGTLFL
jgi:hypothetical protein